MRDDDVREAYRKLLSTTQVRVHHVARAMQVTPGTQGVIATELQASFEDLLPIAVKDDDEVAPSALERLEQGTETLDQLETAMREESHTDLLGITRTLTRLLKNAVASCKYVCADDIHEFACGTTSPGPRCPDGKKYRRVLR
jgi:hypothetical protein